MNKPSPPHSGARHDLEGALAAPPLQHLTVLAARDPHAAVLAARLEPHTSITFEDRNDLAMHLVELSRTLPDRPRTLDLVGLTGLDKLLTFHGRAVDTRSRRVRAYFRELAEHEVPAGLGLVAVRLVGCSTATGEHARRTLGALSEILGVEVTGTTELVTATDSGTGRIRRSVAAELVELGPLPGPRRTLAASTGSRRERSHPGPGQ